MNLRYEVGGMVPDRMEEFEGKHIVVAKDIQSESPLLSLYAISFLDRRRGLMLQHSDIARNFDVANDPSMLILGGGTLTVIDSAVLFGDYSKKYKGVPPGVLSRFGELISDGREVVVPKLEDITHRILWYKWEKFGFSKDGSEAQPPPS